MSLTLERKLPIILFFVFLTLTAIGIVFYRTTVSLQAAIDWQKQSQEVLEMIDNTMAAVLEVQPAVNAFNVLGVDNYLDPMNRARPKIAQNIARLRILTDDDPAQAAEVERLDGLVKGYFDTADKKIEDRKQNGRDETNIGLIWTEGKATLDQIRTSAEKVKTIEIASLQRHEQSSDRRLSWTVWILIVSSVAGVIFLGLANIVVFSEARKRRKAQNALIQANRHLEANIAERTVELSNANEKLKKIGAEREEILLMEQRSRREAEIANRLRDEFMASVSHELRTPLNSILGWARLMKAGNLDLDQSSKALSTIIKNSETQNRLIEDLLDVARVISGKLQLDLHELEPAEIVANAIETVRPIADAKHMKITLAVEGTDGDHVVNGDRNRMTQIFTNLLMNSIKFSPDGSPIDVAVSFAENEAAISITDNGKGISPEFLPLVFERFRQDTSRASKNGGLGLGLAIVRNLAEVHGGSVLAESDGENMGSTFTVVLPMAKNSTIVSKQELDGV